MPTEVEVSSPSSVSSPVSQAPAAPSLSSQLDSSVATPQETATNQATTSTAVVNPPWQVKWKRPQWDDVVLGIDLDENDTPNDNQLDTDALDPDATDTASNNNTKNGNVRDGLNKNWTPVSSSSIVLTRREARMAILELHRQDKLLIRGVSSLMMNGHVGVVVVRSGCLNLNGQPSGRFKSI